jgi:hypothetical protein
MRACGARLVWGRVYLAIIVRGGHALEILGVLPVEILCIDCRKVSVTRAILVSSNAAISYSLVNGMRIIWREVSPIFTTMIQSSSGKGSTMLFGKGQTSTEYPNASILRTRTWMLGRPLGNVRDSPQNRLKV